MRSAIKHICILALVTLVTGCTYPQNEPLLACPAVPINTNSPDFYSAIPASTADAFYNCQLYNFSLQARQDPNFMYLPPAELSALQLGLQYQQNLWRRLAHREIMPGAAQQLWLEFTNDQNFQRAQLHQATRSADAAEDSIFDHSYGSYKKPNKNKRSESRNPKPSAGAKPDANDIKDQLLGK